MMPSLPPLQISASSSASSDAKGGAIGTTAGSVQGDWNVNFGDGSIATSKGLNVWLMAGAALVALWILKRKQ